MLFNYNSGSGDRFPLPEFTGDRFPFQVSVNNTARQLGPLTRVVNSGSGNWKPGLSPYRLLFVIIKCHLVGDVKDGINYSVLGSNALLFE